MRAAPAAAPALPSGAARAARPPAAAAPPAAAPVLLPAGAAPPTAAAAAAALLAATTGEAQRDRRDLVLLYRVSMILDGDVGFVLSLFCGQFIVCARGNRCKNVGEMRYV